MLEAIVAIGAVIVIPTLGYSLKWLSVLESRVTTTEALMGEMKGDLQEIKESIRSIESYLIQRSLTPRA